MVYFLLFSQTHVAILRLPCLRFSPVFFILFIFAFFFQTQAVVLVAALVIAPSFVAFLAIELVVQVYTWWHFC